MDSAGDRDRRSRHPGGANFLFMDGGVKLLADGLDESVLWQMGTIGNGEPVSAENDL